MPLAEILSAVRQEAEAEITRITEETDARIAEIEAEAEERAEKAETTAARSRDADAAQDRARIVNQARLEADRLLRDTAEDLYEEARRRLIERLSDLHHQDRYPEVLERLLDEALAVIPDPEVVVVAEPDADLCAELLVRRGVEAEVDAGGDRAGLVVRTGDGRTLDNTFATRVHRADAHLRRLAGEVVPLLRDPRP